MTGSRVTAPKGGRRPLEMGLICASPQAIRSGPAPSVWVSDPSARLSSGRSVGIMDELTPGAQGDSPVGGAGGGGGRWGSRLNPAGGSLGDRHLLRELSSTGADEHRSQRRPRTLELGGWREAGNPRPPVNYELQRLATPQPSPLQTLAPLLTSNLAVTLKWLKFGTSSKAFPGPIR